MGFTHAADQKKTFLRRSLAIGVEVRVASLGVSFGALACSLRASSVVLSTFHELDVGTEVMALLSLPDGPIEISGVVVGRNTVACEDPGSYGIAVRFDDVDDLQRMRLSSAASCMPSPTARVA